MVNSHVILMRLTVMMLESIANKMRLVAYTEVRVLDELGGISYPSDAVFSCTVCIRVSRFNENFEFHDAKLDWDVFTDEYYE